MLELVDLVAGYRTRHGLPGRRGEVRAVGESGCDKSTVARAVVNLIRPFSGEIRFDGRSLVGMSRDQRRDVQLVFQDPNASPNPRMTVRELITEAWRIHPGIVSRDAWDAEFPRRRGRLPGVAFTRGVGGRMSCAGSRSLRLRFVGVIRWLVTTRHKPPMAVRTTCADNSERYFENGAIRHDHAVAAGSAVRVNTVTLRMPGRFLLCRPSLVRGLSGPNMEAWMFSIQIQLASNGRIAAVYCGGRPKKLFGLEGDHTTAWHVITEGVGNVLRGRTLPEAFGIMRELCEKLTQLPGYRFIRRLEESQLGERVVATNRQLTEFYTVAATVLEEAQQESLERKQRATALLIEVQPRQSLRLTLLQNFIRAYLEMRYLVPFSVVLLGLAHGKGEPARLQKLRDCHMTLAENPGVVLAPDTLAVLRINMWGLLDVQTVAELGMANLGYHQVARSTLVRLAELAQQPKIAALADLPTLKALVTLCKGGPVTKQTDLNKLLTMARMATLLVIERGHGTDDTIPSSDLLFVDVECHTLEERLAAALSQHLISLSWAYPLLYERSGIATPRAVTAFLVKHGCETSLAERVLACMKPFDMLKNVAVAVHDSERRYALEEIVLEDEDEDGNVPVRPGAFAVQLNVDNDLIITEVRQGGRPEPTFGSSLGDHTTAWGVIEYGVRNAILFKRVPDAIQNMVALAKNSLTLPGIRLEKNLDPRHAERYRWAGEELSGLEKLFKAPNGELSLSLLENYVRGYLLFRHIIPLTAINNGIASGHGEPAHLQAVQAAEEWSRSNKSIAPDQKSALRLAMWALLDMNALLILATDNKDNPNWNYTSPGPPVLERQPYSTLGANLLSFKQTLACGIQQHLMTLCASFPNVYPICQIGTKQAVAAVLTRFGVFDAADIVTMLQNAGIVVDDSSVAVAPAELNAPVPAGKKTTKNQDEASYEDDGDGDDMW